MQGKFKLTTPVAFTISNENIKVRKPFERQSYSGRRHYLWFGPNVCWRLEWEKETLLKMDLRLLKKINSKTLPKEIILTRLNKSHQTFASCSLCFNFKLHYSSRFFFKSFDGFTIFSTSIKHLHNEISYELTIKNKRLFKVLIFDLCTYVPKSSIL